MRKWIDAIQKMLTEGEVVDLHQHKTDRAFADYANAMQNVYRGESEFFKTGKFLPFAQAYIESGFNSEFRPRVFLSVEIKPYRKSPKLRDFIAGLRRQRFEINSTKYHKDFPMAQRTGPWCTKEIWLDDLRSIWAQRGHSPYGAYQPSRSGFRTSHEENYDERGVGFNISVLGFDPRRGDKYGNPTREEDHIIDDDKDYQEVIEMFAAIQRARMKSV